MKESRKGILVKALHKGKGDLWKEGGAHQDHCFGGEIVRGGEGRFFLQSSQKERKEAARRVMKGRQSTA